MLIRSTARAPALLVLASAACLAAAPAFAQQAPASADPDRISSAHQVRSNEPAIYRQQATIRFEDLDLSTVAGARTMYLRIRDAATRVCTMPAERRVEPVDEDARNTCRREAIAGVLKQLDSPQVRAAALEHPRTELASR